MKAWYVYSRHSLFFLQKMQICFWGMWHVINPFTFSFHWSWIENAFSDEEKKYSTVNILYIFEYLKPILRKQDPVKYHTTNWLLLLFLQLLKIHTAWKFQGYIEGNKWHLQIPHFPNYLYNEKSRVYTMVLSIHHSRQGRVKIDHTSN